MMHETTLTRNFSSNMEFPSPNPNCDYQSQQHQSFMQVSANGGSHGSIFNPQQQNEEMADSLTA